MNGTYLNNTKILSISLAAALFMTGCNAGDITPSTVETEPKLISAVPSATPIPTFTPVPAVPPAEKAAWSKALFVEEKGNFGGYLITSDVKDNRKAYQPEFNEHILSAIDSKLLTEEQKEHFYAYCDALWKHEEETVCKDEEEWKLLNKLADIYHPMISFTDEKTYTDKGSGKAAISYKTGIEDYEKKVFELKLRLGELYLHSGLREGDPSVVRAYKLLMTISHECEYDRGVMRHGMYETLTKGKGICSDYAKALTYLYLQCGIDAEYISGKVWEGVGHSLTAVKGGEDSYFLADLTWEATYCHYPRFFGEIPASGENGESPYESLKVKRVGAAGLYDPKELKLDCDAYRKLVDSIWSDYNCVDNAFNYIGYDTVSDQDEFIKDNDQMKLFSKMEENSGKVQVLSD